MCDLCNQVSRRTFLGTSATLAGGLLISGLEESQARAQVVINEWEQQPPVRVYVVYLGLASGWPNLHFDPTNEIQNVFMPCLKQTAQNLGDVEFIGGDLIPNYMDAANQLLPKIAEQKADAVLIIHFSCSNTDVCFAAFASTGLPVAIYARPFSGHEWVYVNSLQHAGAKIIASFSRDLNEVERLVGLLRVPSRMKSAKLIVLGPPGCAAGTAAAQDYGKVKEKFGTEVIHVTPDEFVEVHKSTSEDEAIDEAENYWIKPAHEIREPSREEIIKSCKTYLAMKKLMKQRGARALTIKCLGGVPIDILGYPCLGFSHILDDGAIGACEADMDSTLNMMMMLYATGLPGFITDPVMDFATNAVIHAHCVSATKMAGTKTERLPFIIRTHLEDDQGASLKVLMDREINREVTWTKLANNNTLLVATGIIREDYDLDDRGCRTRIVAEVTSTTARELFNKWGGNVIGRDIMARLHRVVFFGNHMDNFRDIAQLMELKFMVEGKDWA